MAGNAGCYRHAKSGTHRRVAELRRDGRTPKEIARALGLKPAEVAPLIRAVGAAAPAREAKLVGCWITDG